MSVGFGSSRGGDIDGVAILISYLPIEIKNKGG